MDSMYFWDGSFLDESFYITTWWTLSWIFHFSVFLKWKHGLGLAIQFNANFFYFSQVLNSELTIIQICRGWVEFYHYVASAAGLKSLKLGSWNLLLLWDKPSSQENGGPGQGRTSQFSESPIISLWYHQKRNLRQPWKFKSWMTSPVAVLRRGQYSTRHSTKTSWAVSDFHLALWICQLKIQFLRS